MNIRFLSAIALMLLQIVSSGGAQTEAGVEKEAPAERSGPDPSPTRATRTASFNISAGSIAFRSDTVTVMINRVRRIDPMDPPPDTRADFYDPSSDDRCDINPRPGATDINITYNLHTGAITGDVTGIRRRLISVHGGGDAKRAQIWFTVYNR